MRSANSTSNPSARAFASCGLKRGWTLQNLAGASGLSKTFLSRLESGDRQASIAAVLTLSRVLDVSLAFLFESELATEPCVIVRGAETAGGKCANGLVLRSAFQYGPFLQLCNQCVCVLAIGRGEARSIIITMARNGFTFCPAPSRYH